MFDGSSGLLAGKWRFCARLVTPFYVGPFLVGAIAMFDGGTFTQILGIVLGIDDYPELFLNIGSEYDARFPDGIDVVPDRPAVPWV